MIVAQTAGYTEYSDGSTEVYYSEAEVAQLYSDPRFGYVCRNLHVLTSVEREGMFRGYDITCGACDAEAEAYGAALEEAALLAAYLERRP